MGARKKDLLSTVFSSSTVFGRRIRIVLILLIVSVLAASILTTARVREVYGYATPSYQIGQGTVQQTAESVVAAFDAALNAHNVKAGLDVFTDDAVVHDAARETYSNSLGLMPGSMGSLSPSVAPTCFASASQTSADCVYSGKDKIGEWLQQLVAENIQVQEVDGFQTNGNNVTWNLAVSDDIYRSLGIPSLAEVGFATVQGSKIQSLTLSLTPESTTELLTAVGKSERVAGNLEVGGLFVGLTALALVLPLGSIYYISRVKSLFAAIPRLERPWLLLEAGVCLLLLDVILTTLGNFLGIPSGIADVFGKAVLVASTGVFLIGMVLMKHAWTIPSSE